MGMPSNNMSATHVDENLQIQLNGYMLSCNYQIPDDWQDFSFHGRCWVLDAHSRVELAVLKSGTEREGHFAATNKARGNVFREMYLIFKKKKLCEERVEKMNTDVGPWGHDS